MKLSPTLVCDFYKLSHNVQYPPNTEFVYSNTTPRASRIEGIKEVVVFGYQYLVKEYLIDHWNNEFFNRPVNEVIHEFKRITDHTLGKDAIATDHLVQLHKLGYLPLHIKALPEGTLCPIRVPMMTIVNTHKDFFWLTNFVESLTQTVVWQGITSATIAREYHKILSDYAELTSDTPEFVQWQAHDFSMRGMSSVETGAVSGAGHLLTFTGTDSIPAIQFLEQYYLADVTKELVGGSVSATEHSVMCAGGEDDEQETFRRIIEDIYPSGIVSIVSDTWDFWKVLTETLPSLKEKIMSRNGKVVIRPDSGDPVKIVTGYFPKHVSMTLAAAKRKNSTMSGHESLWGEGHDALCLIDGTFVDRDFEILTPEEVKGAVAVLYDVFGGKKNSKGYIDLDPHIGLIYGDSITLTRCQQICERLARKGFASTNVVFGVGSYTYQYNTRDTFSIACKATWVQVADKAKPIFKDPKTDGGTKKSAKGLLRIVRKDGTLVMEDNVTAEEEKTGELRTIFLNGVMHNQQSLAEIRSILNAQ